MKFTDYNEVNTLAENIVKDVTAMSVLCEEMDNELKKLEGTFFDDGIEDIKEFVKSTQSRINNNQESLEVIAKQLINLANLLEEGK